MRKAEKILLILAALAALGATLTHGLGSKTDEYFCSWEASTSTVDCDTPLASFFTDIDTDYGSEVVTSDWTFNGPLALGDTFDLGNFVAIGADTTPAVDASVLYEADTAQTITSLDSMGVGWLTIIYTSIDGVIFDCTTSSLSCGIADITTDTGDVTVWIRAGSSPSRRLISWYDASADYTYTPNELGSSLTSSTNDITATSGDQVCFGNGTEDFCFDHGTSNQLRVASNTGVNNINWMGWSHTTTNQASHRWNMNQWSTANPSLTSANLSTGNISTYTYAGNVEVEMGSASDGAHGWIYDLDGTATTTFCVDPAVADSFYLPNSGSVTKLTAGNKVCAPTATLGAYIHYIGIDSNTWLILDHYPYDAWTDGGA